jgi:hypothetical protein
MVNGSSGRRPIPVATAIRKQATAIRKQATAIRKQATARGGPRAAWSLQCISPHLERVNAPASWCSDAFIWDPK